MNQLCGCFVTVNIFFGRYAYIPHISYVFTYPSPKNFDVYISNNILAMLAKAQLCMPNHTGIAQC